MLWYTKTHIQDNHRIDYYCKCYIHWNWFIYLTKDVGVCKGWIKKCTLECIKKTVKYFTIILNTEFACLQYLCLVHFLYASAINKLNSTTVHQFKNNTTLVRWLVYTGDMILKNSNHLQSLMFKNLNESYFKNFYYKSYVIE